jgi:hypothetical protein
MPNRPIVLLSLPERGTFEVLTGGLNEVFEVEELHASPQEEGVHAALTDERWQRAAEHKSVKARQNTRDRGTVSC